MQWERVITDPLGIAGFALSLVFTLTTRAISQKRKEQNRWLALAAYTLAVICVVGGLSLAWHRDSAKAMATPAPAQQAPSASQTGPQPPSITTGDINQTGDGNVAAVQGNVSTSPRKKKSPANK